MFNKIMSMKGQLMKKTQLLSFLVLAGSMQSSCMFKLYCDKGEVLNVGNKVSCKKPNFSFAIRQSLLEKNVLDKSKACTLQEHNEALQQNNFFNGTKRTKTVQKGTSNTAFSSRSRKQQQRYNRQNKGGGRYGGSRGLSGRFNRNMKQKKYGRNNR